MGVEPSREQTAVRLLFLLDRLGDPCDTDDIPADAVKMIRAQRKIQKLDFLLRNPDYLANEIVSAYEAGRLPAANLLDARRAMLEQEPELHTYRMLRDQHGAFEPLNDALLVLKHLGLITIRRAGSITDDYVRRRDYYLLAAGAAQAGKLRADVPELSWYDQQCAVLALVVGGMSGGQLKELEYAYPEYANAVPGQLIGGIGDRVRARLHEALQREGLH
jgi:hypothetical protein